MPAPGGAGPFASGRTWPAPSPHRIVMLPDTAGGSMSNGTIALRTALVGWGLAVLAQPAAAQPKILLRYHPRANATTHLVVWTDNTITFTNLTGFPDAAPGDSVRIESDAIQGVTDRVEQVGPSYIVARTMDSVRARARVGGGQWTPVLQAEALRGRTARLTLDDRLHVAGLTLAGHDSDTGPVPYTFQTIASGDLALELPDEALGAGDRWTADMVYPMNAGAGGIAAMRDTTVWLHTRAAMTLDSIVPRGGGADTLVYLRVAGTLDSLTVPEHSDSASGTATLRGGVGGTIIWSTAWNAFVSGALRYVATAQLQLMRRGHQAGATVYVDTRRRIQVRP
jgi:hypothetical protein